LIVTTATPASPEAAAAPATTEDTSIQLVVFSLGDHEYGVPITTVQEIIRYSPPRPIPDSPAQVEGVINLRGRIIPVIDLQVLLGIQGFRATDSKVVVIELPEATVGIIVDEVREVLTVDLAATEPPPVSVVSGARESIQSVAKLEGRLLVILDIVRLLGVDGTAA